MGWVESFGSTYHTSRFDLKKLGSICPMNSQLYNFFFFAKKLYFHQFVSQNKNGFQINPWESMSGLHEFCCCSGYTQSSTLEWDEQLSLLLIPNWYSIIWQLASSWLYLRTISSFNCFSSQARFKEVLDKTRKVYNSISTILVVLKVL